MVACRFLVSLMVISPRYSSGSHPPVGCLIVELGGGGMLCNQRLPYFGFQMSPKASQYMEVLGFSI
jgi:hypothetical protein